MTTACCSSSCSRQAAARPSCMSHMRRAPRQRCPAARAAAATSSQGQQEQQQTPLESSRRLAALRARESLRATPLLTDTYAAALAEGFLAAPLAQQQQGQSDGQQQSPQQQQQQQPHMPQSEAEGQGAAARGAADAEEESDAQAPYDLLTTRFLDEQALKAVGMVNMERDLTKEYNQVVLVGDGFDTRPYRLPWPTGTVLFSLAPAEVHERAEAALAACKARVPRGCLLRRVRADLARGGDCAAALERAGYRGDRLSVWVLQGCASQGWGQAALNTLFTDASNLAAFDSLLVGELPPMERRAVDNLLASFGLLGTAVDFGENTDYGRWEPRLVLDPGATRRWLFLGQQKRLSLAEMGLYSDHVAAAEANDEDFFGNFS